MRYLLTLLILAWTVVSAILTSIGVWSIPLVAIILPAIIWFGFAFLVGLVVLIAGITVAVKARNAVRRDTFGSFGRI